VLAALASGETLKVRAALLAFGSASDDNTEATRRLVVKRWGKLVEGSVAEIRVGTLGLTDAVYALEELGSPPAKLKGQLPSLDEKTWRALCRILLLLLVSATEALIPPKSGAPRRAQSFHT
jgi:hypothetical protein